MSLPSQHAGNRGSSSGVHDGHKTDQNNAPRRLSAAAKALDQRAKLQQWRQRRELEEAKRRTPALGQRGKENTLLSTSSTSGKSTIITARASAAAATNTTAAGAVAPSTVNVSTMSRLSVPKTRAVSTLAPNHHQRAPMARDSLGRSRTVAKAPVPSEMAPAATKHTIIQAAVRQAPARAAVTSSRPSGLLRPTASPYRKRQASIDDEASKAVPTERVQGSTSSNTSFTSTTSRSLRQPSPTRRARELSAGEVNATDRRKQSGAVVRDPSNARSATANGSQRLGLATGLTPPRRRASVGHSPSIGVPEPGILSTGGYNRQPPAPPTHSSLKQDEETDTNATAPVARLRRFGTVPPCAARSPSLRYGQEQKCLGGREGGTPSDVAATESAPHVSQKTSVELSASRSTYSQAADVGGNCGQVLPPVPTSPKTNVAPDKSALDGAPPAPQAKEADSSGHSNAAQSVAERSSALEHGQTEQAVRSWVWEAPASTSGLSKLPPRRLSDSFGKKSTLAAKPSNRRNSMGNARSTVDQGGSGSPRNPESSEEGRKDSLKGNDQIRSIVSPSRTRSPGREILRTSSGIPSTRLPSPGQRARIPSGIADSPRRRRASAGSVANSGCERSATACPRQMTSPGRSPPLSPALSPRFRRRSGLRRPVSSSNGHSDVGASHMDRPARRSPLFPGPAYVAGHEAHRDNADENLVKGDASARRGAGSERPSRVLDEETVSIEKGVSTQIIEPNSSAVASGSEMGIDDKPPAMVPPASATPPQTMANEIALSSREHRSVPNRSVSPDEDDRGKGCSEEIAVDTTLAWGFVEERRKRRPTTDASTSCTSVPPQCSMRTTTAPGERSAPNVDDSTSVQSADSEEEGSIISSGSSSSEEQEEHEEEDDESLSSEGEVDEEPWRGVMRSYELSRGDDLVIDPDLVRSSSSSSISAGSTRSSLLRSSDDEVHHRGRSSSVTSEANTAKGPVAPATFATAESGTQTLSRRVAHAHIQAGEGRLLSEDELQDQANARELRERLSMMSHDLAAEVFHREVVKQEQEQMRKKLVEAHDEEVAQLRSQLKEMEVEHNREKIRMRWEHAEELEAERTDTQDGSVVKEELEEMRKLREQDRVYHAKVLETERARLKEARAGLLEAERTNREARKRQKMLEDILKKIMEENEELRSLNEDGELDEEQEQQQ